MPAMIGSIATFAVMSLVCAFAWNYKLLLAFRTLQGIGLGGEVPIAAVYISELTRTRSRPFRDAVRDGVPGRAGGGQTVAIWVVPNLGWQTMFIIGALPAIPALCLRASCRNCRGGSPRWAPAGGRSRAA